MGAGEELWEAMDKEEEETERAEAEVGVERAAVEARATEREAVAAADAPAAARHSQTRACRSTAAVKRGPSARGSPWVGERVARK